MNHAELINLTNRLTQAKPASRKLTSDDLFGPTIKADNNSIQCERVASYSIPPHVQAIMGDFNTFSVEELISKSKSKLKSTPVLIVTTRKSMNMEHLFDTSSLQVSGPKGAMYQVASNFNCIEVGSEMTNPFNGRFLTRLMSDKTQGPSASAGAGAGAILRLAKHRETPISLLKSVKGIKDNNGKVYHDNIHIVPDFTKIHIGLHTNVRAT